MVRLGGNVRQVELQDTHRGLEIQGLILRHGNEREERKGIVGRDLHGIPIRRIALGILGQAVAVLMVADRSDDADGRLVIISGSDISIARDVHGNVIGLVAVFDLTHEVSRRTGGLSHERSPVPLFFSSAADIDDISFNPGERLVVRIFSPGLPFLRESGFQGDSVGLSVVFGSDGRLDFLVAGNGENAGEGKNAIE